jgi:hypothetical protein
MSFTVQRSAFRVREIEHRVSSIAYRVLIVCASLLLLMAAVQAFAADSPTIEKLDGGTGWVNWDRQVVKAVGHGILPGDAEDEAQARLMARSAAIADAYRNLASVTKGVRVTGETCVKNFITESDEVRLKVEGFIRGAEIISEKQLSDRSFEVILQAPLVGEDGLIAGLGSEVLGQGEASSATDGEFTGLLIDTRGLDVRPAMSPKVYDEDGSEVYGTVKCSPEFAIEVGIAGYPRGMDQALKSPRIGAHPLIVKALRRGPKFATDIILANSDAARIRDADAKSGFLAKCGVSILLGR